MYDLHRLGWHNFQQLALAVAREIWGQTVESFLDTNDAGRDGAFSGSWTSEGGDSLSGRFVVQCKHTEKRDYNLKPSDLSDELPKAARLVKDGRCDCYILLTNAGISGSLAATLEDNFRAVGVKQFRCFGSTWLNDQIQQSKRLRMLVPRVYGLGDLTQILDERAYAQAEALLSTMRDDLSKIVMTHSYERSAKALDEHGFVLLVGEPAAGKTTIASLLAVSALDQWGASPLKLDTPDRVIDHWNPNEPSQFFWIDDAFGVTQYEASLARGWNHIFNQVRAMINKGARVVMTSRDYIYNQARHDLKTSAFPLLNESQVVVDVHNLSMEERRQILYNHLKMGTQPKAFRQNIKPYLEQIAAHQRFIPEVARRLSDPFFTQDLRLLEENILDFVERQEAFLQDVLQGLDTDSRAALALVFMRNDRLPSPIELQESEREALERLGSTLGACRAALQALNGSLIRHITDENEALWQFKHPTVGDAFSELLIADPELLGIYAQGSPTEKLLRQVTCGEAGVENAVLLGPQLFPLMVNRLENLQATANDGWSSRDRTYSFLARRCSRAFLETYLARHPDILDRVSSPGLMLESVSEVDLALRLHELRLLPEEHRAHFVQVVSEYAIDGEDPAPLSKGSLQAIFTREELDFLISRARSELTPNLSSVRYDWEANYPPDDDPEQYIWPFQELLDHLEKLFPQDPEVAMNVARQRADVAEWIAEKEEQQNEANKKPPRRILERSVSQADEFGERSIFDDVDF